MEDIPGIELKECIYESQRVSIYKGVDLQQSPVIVKIPAAYTFGAESLARIEREFQLGSQINSPGIIRMYSLESVGHNKAIVMEDFGGISLKKYLAITKLGLHEFLNLSVGLSDILHQLHHYQIIHRDIKPANILIDPETGELKLIDLSLARKLSTRSHIPFVQTKLEGSLEYLPPEQTGRVNRSVGFHSDLYSLGATFYEMLAGRPPFIADDPISLVHAHIAKTPDPIQAEFEVPEIVSEIVLKLLSKMAEDRYQEAVGLKHDLEKCQIILKDEKELVGFELGEKDLPRHFRIPEKIYGREKELSCLIDSFLETVQGDTRVIFLTGREGIGKAKLADEMKRLTMEQNGYFVSGRSEQSANPAPYKVLTRVFEDLIQLLLADSPQKLESLKKVLITRLGSQFSDITGIIPSMELVLGKATEPVQPESQRSSHRFVPGMIAFLQSVASPDTPLVIYLEDIQWMSESSKKLFVELLKEPGLSNILFIGSYRSTVPEATGITRLIEEVRQSLNDRITELEMEPLQLSDINRLLSDMLHVEMTETKELAQLVKQKTNGIPFFMIDYLKRLAHKELIYFDKERLKWKWKISDARRQKASINVVESMLEQFSDLPVSTRDYLSAASCMGNFFETDLLSKVLGIEPSDLTPLIRKAADLGLVNQLGETFDKDNTNTLYRFSHPDIRQGIYEQIASEKQVDFHLKTGRLLLEGLPEEQQEEKLFDIVNHFNLAGELIKEPVELVRLSSLNLRACQKARSSAAFEFASKFADKGLSFLPADHWKYHYKLSLQLFREKAISEYAAQRDKSASAMFEGILENAQSKLDKFDVYMDWIKQLKSRSDYATASQRVLECLRTIGVEIPDSKTGMQAALKEEQKKIKTLLEEVPLSEQLNQPAMTDPCQLAIVKILVEVGIESLFINGDFFMTALLGAKGINLVLENGHSIYSSYLLAFLANSMAFRKQYAIAEEAGQLALNISRNYPNPYVDRRMYLEYSAFVQPFNRHLKLNKEQLQTHFKSGLEEGDFDSASNILWHEMLNDFIMGENVQQIYGANKQHLDYIGRYKHLSKPLLGLFEVHIKYYVETAENRNADQGDYFSSKRFKLIANSPSGVTVYYLLTLMQLYLTDQHEQMAIYAKKTIADKAIFATTWVYTHYSLFYFGIALLRDYRTGAYTKPEEYDFYDVIEVIRSEYKIYSGACRVNFEAAYLIIEAEHARNCGNDISAMKLYSQAIESAYNAGFTSFEAIANELAAEFYRTLDIKEVCAVHIGKAIQLYKLWGMTEKVEYLTKEFADFLVLWKRSLSSRQDSVVSPHSSQTHESLTEQIDLKSIIQASRVLSGEMVLDRLIENLLKIMIENSGAQKGVLIMPRGDELVIEAEGLMELDKVRYFPSTPLLESKIVPHSVIGYVHRTSATLVLDDVSKEHHYQKDSYIQNRQPKSILCMPVIHSQKLLAILYFENYLSTGIFSPERIKTLEILASQAAISVENASIYNDLLKEVSERRQAEESLRSSEKKYRLVTENTNIVIWTMNLRGKFTFISPSITRLVGYTPEEFVKLKSADYLTPESEKMATEAFYESAHNLKSGTEQRLSLQLECIRKDGTRFWGELQMKSSVFGEEPEPSYIGVLRDITTRKKAEDELANYREHLEELVDERSKQLKKAQKELLEKAHRAGMADIAADILHNIGNILNSAHVSIQSLEKMSSSSGLSDLQRANQLLDENMDSLESFILDDPKGVLLLKYYAMVEKELSEEFTGYYADVKRLGEKLEMISTAINTQKNYIGIDSQNEMLELSQVVEDILTIQAGLIERNGVRIVNQLKPMQSIPIQKVKLMHILISIINNSVDAMIDLSPENRQILVQGEESDESVILRISDKGRGIKQENLTKIFTQGYTTKRDSQGFALHTCANYMADMRGSINAESKGIGQGATFILTFKKQTDSAPI